MFFVIKYDPPSARRLDVKSTKAKVRKLGSRIKAAHISFYNMDLSNVSSISDPVVPKYILLKCR